MSTADAVDEHYSRGSLREAFLEALARTGRDLAHISAADLAGADQFHLGGLDVIRDLAASMDIRPGMFLLDIGSGVGGPARYFASEHACDVTGVDLTKEFVEVARELTRMVGLSASVRFLHASAMDLPMGDASIDRACMIHVGMNIPDKPAVFREVRRVLKPSGLFAIFDVLRVAEGTLRFPLPWAETEDSSFVEDANSYRASLEATGFTVVRERGRGALAIESTRKVMAHMASPGPPPLGLQLLMGARTPVLIANLLFAMERGLLEPVEMIARAI